MAKKIIILTKSNPWPGQNTINYVLWATVPTARQILYTKPIDWVSAYSDATTQELTDLRSGVIVERVESTNIPAGTATATIKSILQDSFTRFQDQVTNDSSWQFFGSYYDGTTWTIGGF